MVGGKQSFVKDSAIGSKALKTQLYRLEQD